MLMSHHQTSPSTKTYKEEIGPRNQRLRDYALEFDDESTSPIARVITMQVLQEF